MLKGLDIDKASWDPAQALRDVPHTFGERGGVNASISPSTTFTTMDPETMTDIFAGKVPMGHYSPDKGGCYLYARHYSPDTARFGTRFAAFEALQHGEFTGYGSASGMSMITTVVRQLAEAERMTLAQILQNSGIDIPVEAVGHLPLSDEYLKHEDRVVASGAVYGGTHAFFENILPKRAVGTTFVRPTDTAAFEAAIGPRTQVVFTEVMANPTLELVDLEAISGFAVDHDAVLVVDNTFTTGACTPALHVHPDTKLVVVCSGTKFLDGRSKRVNGAVACSRSFLDAMMDLEFGEMMIGGPTMDYSAAADLDMRLNDLPIRVRAHSERAMEFAKRIEAKGLKVFYPGLDSYPQRERANELFNLDAGYGYGGIISIDFGSEEKANAFVKKAQELNAGFNAVSLGYCHTLMSVSGSSTSAEIADEDQAKMGLGKGLVRVSIGYTGSLEDEWAKFEQAIDFSMAA